MSSFTKPLITQYMHDTKNWMLPVGAGFRYWIGSENSGTYVDVPDGFRTDGASVPRPFWNLVAPWGDHGQAAVLHDFLCEYRTIIRDGKPTSISRKECDEIFLEAMRVLKVEEVKAKAMYAAVRAYAISTGKR